MCISSWIIDVNNNVIGSISSVSSALAILHVHVQNNCARLAHVTVRTRVLATLMCRHVLVTCITRGERLLANITAKVL